MALGLTPLMPFEIQAGWRIAAVFALTAGAFVLARAGVGRMRAGAWEGGSSTGLAKASAPRARRAFGSAFRAQFWLEWRRQGLKLPLFTSLGLSLFILVQAAIWLVGVVGKGQPLGDEFVGDTSRLILNFLIITPLVCSLLLGSIIATFEPGQSATEMPVFVAVRPMTDGGLVLAKLAMTALSSLLTWFVVAAAMLVCLVFSGHAASLAHPLWSKPADFVLVLLPALLILALVTWRNLVAGLWIGLSGRSPLIRGGVDYARVVFYFGLCALVVRALNQPPFRAALLDWMPWVLTGCLGLKLATSAAAFGVALRRKAVSYNDIRWFIAGWLGCGLFAAILAWGLCARLGATQFWIWVALAGFCLLPLAELSLAPLALAGDRHR